MYFFGYIRKNIKCLLTFSVLALCFLGGFSNAASDLLWQAIKPAYDSDVIITMGENVNQVGESIIEGSKVSVGAGTHGAFIGKKASIIVKITKILLSLVIALSVTMILYNGMMYIVQTGQGKETKDLTKNIAYIVIGILLSLFSVVIITLIQSVPKTLDDELISDSYSKKDNKVVNEHVGKRLW